MAGIVFPSYIQYIRAVTVHWRYIHKGGFSLQRLVKDFTVDYFGHSGGSVTVDYGGGGGTAYLLGLSQQGMLHTGIASVENQCQVKPL